MDFGKIDEILSGEPKFRAKQVGQLIWRDLIEDWEQATTLPAVLREKLKAEAPLKIKAEVFPDKDGRSTKALIILEDGLNVETVLMRHSRRNTVCVSSQVGCPLGCLFCATGKMGFKRNLSVGEIAEQVLFWARWLNHPTPTLPLAEEGKNRINNIVFMGMGEPFLNYDNVFGAMKILNDDNFLGIGARHISISTAGIVPGIKRFTQDMTQINPHVYSDFLDSDKNKSENKIFQTKKKEDGRLGVGVNLAISLHAPNDELRQKLMPVAKKYPLAQVMAAAADYAERTNRKLMFEYIMIKGVNDSVKQARELANLLDNRLYFVNLIVYNQTGDFTPSDASQVKKFKDVLMKSGIQALERYRFGQDIAGACGQLSSR